ncbi:MAG: hypothetical protein D6768_01670 [Chloroflexi bacterium]|nr:MAG: hypothetical protein D6768_01670 [Chloroflexota bacterium]
MLVGVGMGLLGTSLLGATLFSQFIWPDPQTDPQTEPQSGPADAADCSTGADCRRPVQFRVEPSPGATAQNTSTPLPTATGVARLENAPTRTPLPSLTPPITVTTGLTATDVISAVSRPVTVTVTPAVAARSTATSPVQLAAVEPYTLTRQVAPPPAAQPTATPPQQPTCPLTSTAQFDLIPIEGVSVRDHPDAVHGDLNLALRGFIPVDAPLHQVEYSGSTDSDAPRLHGLFEPNRQAEITAVFRVNNWIWEPAQCGGHPRGCPGPPSENYWPVTLVGLAATPGETIYPPERGSQIYPGGYVALVLYAEETRLTLGYTRRDVVSAGYVVHLENVCVDPNLLALYRAQMDTDGWHASGQLPALRNNQPLGTALDGNIGVAVRDAGTFMDPRSQKDWWR